jgi:hypothetical protein
VSAINLKMLNMMQADLFLDDDVDGGRKQQQRERRFDFDKVLKMTTHADVLELYLFVLQRYKTLDAQTLHAITSFLTRFCDKLNLEPMLYQVCSCMDLWPSSRPYNLNPLHALQQATSQVECMDCHICSISTAWCGCFMAVWTYLVSADMLPEAIPRNTG